MSSGAPLVNNQGWMGGITALLATTVAAYQTVTKPPDIREETSAEIIKLFEMKDAERERAIALAIKRCDIRIAEVERLIGRTPADGADSGAD